MALHSRAHARLYQLLFALLLASMVTPAARSQEADSDGAIEQPPDPDPGPASDADESARRQWLTERIDKLVGSRASLRRARIGVSIVDIGSGEVLYARNADERFNIASNVKLATAAAALSRLGPGFTYQTAVYADEVEPGGIVRGNLYLVGHADPYLTTEDLDRLARHIARAGIKRVTGKLVVDDTYFDRDDLPPHFDEQPDEHASFRAPIGAFSLNFNAFNVIVRPGAGPGSPAEVTTDPPASYLPITSSVTTVGRGRTRIRITATKTVTSLQLQVVGQIRHDANMRTYRRRIPDPFRYAGTAFQDVLRRHGVRLDSNELVRGPTPVTASQLAIRHSPPLAEIVRAMGKFSNNFVAETLFKTLGAELRTDPGTAATWADAQTACANFLVREIGLEPGSFRYENGSGLFSSNEFTPAQLTTLLRTAYLDFRYGPELSASLAIAGVDGTLSKRMHGTSAQHYVRAKTGTLAAVSALSGYAAVRGTRVIAFSVIVNDIPSGRGNIGDARATQDKIAQALVTFLAQDSALTQP